MYEKPTYEDLEQEIKVLEEVVIEAKRRQVALQQSEEKFRVLADLSPAAIMLYQDGHWLYANQATETIFGYTAKELLHMNYWDIAHPDFKVLVQEYGQKFQRGEETTYRYEVKIIKKDGSEMWVELMGASTMIGGRHVGIISAADITERKRAEEKIKHLATHDVLTNLPSLRLAKDRLGMALSLARRNKMAVAVMFADLDGFKSVNDNLGHEAGDYVLKQVAQRLLSCVRETDTVARVGGDEFLIIAPGTHAVENASQIAERIIHRVSQPIIFNRKQAVVGISIGIALYPDDDEDMNQLIKKADEAMYRIKKAGKNGFCFINTKVK
jgi:diguanylate cyclase (GGDEF)-like protein/PAS domain S-box-containing protein